MLISRMTRPPSNGDGLQGDHKHPHFAVGSLLSISTELSQARASKSSWVGHCLEGKAFIEHRLCTGCCGKHHPGSGKHLLFQFWSPCTNPEPRSGDLDACPLVIPVVKVRLCIMSSICPARENPQQGRWEARDLAKTLLLTGWGALALHRQLMDEITSAGGL